MKTAAIAAGALFATSSLAAPGTAARWARHAEAAEAKAAGRHGNIMQPAEGEVSTDNKHVSYSTNWAGAVLVDTGFTEVEGTITAPTPTGSKGSASAWVGIDGDTCSTAILQTGIDFTISKAGVVSYDAWYEWYPDYAYDFSNFAISAGDQISMTVKATSTKAGTATLENLTTGKSTSHSFTGESSSPLCEYNAEWIVEDYESGSALVAFADFGSVTFTGASATKDGSSVGVSGASILDIKQSGSVLTSCSTSGSSSVTCEYTG
ncbi:peptidase A4 family-domain-containing protein [Xylariaceae sp. FL0804]|nr:peptidase A4 family-domain-containing protein [Xylariaceae sp. FL0804]